MSNQVCVNCQNNNHVNGTSNRLVTESCGHVKCMECLLSETTGCQACAREKTGGNSLPTAPDKESKSQVQGEEIEDGKEAEQTDIEASITEQTKEVEDNVLEDSDKPDDIVPNPNEVLVSNSKEVVVPKLNEVDIPVQKGLENAVAVDVAKNIEERDWSTKKIFKPDWPHIRVDKEAGGATTYYCLKCRRQFRARSHVNYHSYCNGTKKPHQCDECNKEFATLTHYQYHMRAHRDERPFACDVCGAAFRHTSKLQRHKLLHSEKQHSCPQCSKSFTTQLALRRHSLVHSGERPHRCPVCDRRFRDHSNYRKHVQRHANALESACLCSGTSSARAHRCPLCPHRAGFRCARDLRRHLHVHNDALPFRCLVCDRRFRRKDNLERHIRNRHPRHSAASAAGCDQEALKERQNITVTPAEPTKIPNPKAASDKTQLEKLNPLPPIPKDVIQSMCDETNPRTTDNTEPADKPVIDKSYILEANHARQSVIVAKITADKQYRDSSPETAYVHKIKKSMANNARGDSMLPPIDTKKLFQFYHKARETDNLDIGAPRPEDVHKLKTILMGDQGERGGQRGERPAMHWRRKMTLNINWLV